jgi:hypothetical protein
MTEQKQPQRPEPVSLLKVGANVDALHALVEEAMRDPKKSAALDLVRARRHAIRILELLA